MNHNLLKILKLLFERPTTHEDGPGCGFDISSMRAKGFVVRASSRPTASDGCVVAGADPSPVAPVALLTTVALVVVLRRRVVDPLRATPSPFGDPRRFVLFPMHAPMAQRDALNKIWAGSLLKLALGSGFQPLYEIKDYFGEV